LKGRLLRSASRNEKILQQSTGLLQVLANARTGEEIGIIKKPYDLPQANYKPVRAHILSLRSLHNSRFFPRYTQTLKLHDNRKIYDGKLLEHSFF